MKQANYREAAIARQRAGALQGNCGAKGEDMHRVTRLILVCRGAALSAREGIFGSDGPLAEGQREAAAALRPLLPRADIFRCAPEASARETAAALASAARGMDPALADPSLADMAYGAWEGRTLAAVAENEADTLECWMRGTGAPPGGESVAALAARVSIWLEAHLRHGGRILAVTHAAVIRAMVLEVLGAPPASFRRIDVTPLSVTEFTGNGERWALRCLGAPAPL